MRREICTQTFHATNHAIKTNNYAISIDNVCKIVNAIKSGAKNIVFTLTKTYLFVLLLRNELTISSPCSDLARYDAGQVNTRVWESKLWKSNLAPRKDCGNVSR